MTWPAPNLARERFENLRPVRRLASLLAVAALALTSWNVHTWIASGAGAQEQTAELERLAQETAAARERIATLEHDLAASDLGAENERTQFLNERIDERVFSWNELLDRLGETMPAGIRLRQLSPGNRGRQPARRRATASRVASDAVALSIRGEAEDHEALLEFIDRLFADPGFGRPDLAQEGTRNDGLVEFDLTVDYRPGKAAPSEATAPTTASTPAPSAAEGEP